MCIFYTASEALVYHNVIYLSVDFLVGDFPRNCFLLIYIFVLVLRRIFGLRSIVLVVIFLVRLVFFPMCTLVLGCVFFRRGKVFVRFLFIILSLCYMYMALLYVCVGGPDFVVLVVR